MIDITKSFWDNKALKEYWKEIWVEDKSLNKRFSSELMWSMYLCYYYEGDYVNLDDESKTIYINEMFSSTDNNILNKIKPNLDKFYKLIETPARKSLRQWETKEIERDKFIYNTPYDAASWEMLDKMRSAKTKGMEEYFKIMSKLNQEIKKSTGESDAELSMSDKGEI